MSEALNISSSPHVRDRWTTPYIMRVVLLSLMPATVMGIIAYGWQAAAIVALALALPNLRQKGYGSARRSEKKEAGSHG